MFVSDCSFLRLLYYIDLVRCNHRFGLFCSHARYTPSKEKDYISSERVRLCVSDATPQTVFQTYAGISFHQRSVLILSHQLSEVSQACWDENTRIKCVINNWRRHHTAWVELAFQFVLFFSLFYAEGVLFDIRIINIGDIFTIKLFYYLYKIILTWIWNIVKDEMCYGEVMVICWKFLGFDCF